MFTFNDEYLLKSMMSLVRDESDRIVSLGLAEHDVLKRFVESELHGVINRADGDKGVVLGKLTDLHNGLNSIRLPGDFEKATKSANQQLLDIIGLEPLSETDTEDTATEPAPQADAEDEDNGSEDIKAICSVLERITYELGKNGRHEAAYLVERTLYKIEATATE